MIGSVKTRDENGCYTNFLVSYSTAHNCVSAMLHLGCSVFLMPLAEM